MSIISKKSKAVVPSMPEGYDDSASLFFIPAPLRAAWAEEVPTITGADIANRVDHLAYADAKSQLGVAALEERNVSTTSPRAYEQHRTELVAARAAAAAEAKDLANNNSEYYQSLARHQIRIERLTSAELSRQRAAREWETHRAEQTCPICGTEGDYRGDSGELVLERMVHAFDNTGGWVSEQLHRVRSCARCFTVVEAQLLDRARTEVVPLARTRQDAVARFVESAGI